jgi:hypothetical protein
MTSHVRSALWTLMNTGVFVVFKTKRELKCQFSGITEILDKLFDVINYNPFFTL